jgi:ferredoxin--NADP+ reductase
VLDQAGKQVPGVYATGWIKRGPIGLIGHTKSDALETIGNLIADKSNWWQPAEPSEDSVTALLDGKSVEYVTWADWLRVDAEEVRLGEAEGRERIKLFDRADFTRVVKND